MTPKMVITILLNFDDGGIQYRSILKRGYVTKELVINAKKTCRSRVTVLYGASMDGYKFKPLVIGKSANPRCFGSRFDKSTLPLRYYHSTRAWMTKDIFFDWFCNHFEPEVAQHFPGFTVYTCLIRELSSPLSQRGT